MNDKFASIVKQMISWLRSKIASPSYTAGFGKFERTYMTHAAAQIHLLASYGKPFSGRDLAQIHSLSARKAAYNETKNGFPFSNGEVVLPDEVLRWCVSALSRESGVPVDQVDAALLKRTESSELTRQAQELHSQIKEIDVSELEDEDSTERRRALAAEQSEILRKLAKPET